MARLGLYNPREIIAYWGPTPILEGAAAGTFVKLARRKRTWRHEKGCDGEAARTRTNNFVGTVDFSLRAGSPINNALSAQLTADELLGLVVLPFLLKDFKGITLWASPLAYLEGWPGDAFGSEEESIRDWRLVCDPLTPFPGGNNEL